MEVGFVPSAYTVVEDRTFVILTVVSRNPNIEREIIVNIETIPGTADEGRF